MESTSNLIGITVEYSWPLLYMTDLQFQVKMAIGLFDGGDWKYEPRFHWRFWLPIDINGGRVYFGRYWVVWKNQKGQP